MTVTNKSESGPGHASEQQPDPAFFGTNGPAGRPAGELVAELRCDDTTPREDLGRFVPTSETNLAERMIDGLSHAAKSVQKSATRTAARAQDTTRSTVQAARDHPGMTVAVIGGIATAAYAGIRLYKARQEPEPRLDRIDQSARKPAVAKPVSRKKH